jgi:hypothetical protein
MFFKSFSSLIFLNPYPQELRVQDYAQGRKTAGSFGQSAAFGTQQPTTGLFGTTQPAQPNQQPSLFGAPANTTSNTGFGAFGGSTTTNQPTAPATTGLFGGTTFGGQQPAQTSAFGGGAFGSTQPQQTQQQTGLFGGGSAFGSTAPKPTFGAFGGGGKSASLDVAASLLNNVKALLLLQLAVLLGVAPHLGDKVNSLPNKQLGVFSEIPNRPQLVHLAEVHLVSCFFSKIF